MTHAEITALDAGAGQRIPTYPEVLEALRDSGIQPGTTRPLSQPASTERETRQLIWRVLLSRGAPVCGLWNRAGWVGYRAGGSCFTDGLLRDAWSD
jgi:hypothetical protein